ncbi:NAD(P)-dependent dehydrogenase (short-subunit alcohol dehydrogenase family) [Actinoalloteichus hoggarensis]|uniref:3-oxoacyl-[acyl-carrier-protein] reductase FabG n=1 Tax=Actinoalloteichus hoggarensis TaxID=1470176 RepID=A0A221W1S4_9PSEU|nr:SDR family NAD(P)-dependent oxidoreductase [Actinoalloteichus hoggarensis]ASO19708.1 3-oxoacyl-[acyl-carrier-protein] reductase FabG [Actinoalloteichus hoggarensis]MBB5919585.1 NAD(P)-dependent dehydrogenase (short-subunit alcohol dehydrogenase family) [Actinoalloteichus hoggarensis]
MSTGRTALITGANRGLGRAVAAVLHARGLRVVLAGRDRTSVAEAVAEMGGPASGCVLDVTDAASVAAARALIGPVDVLVNNAGVLRDGGTDPLTVDLDLVRDTLAVNVLGSWRVSQAFVPDMVSRRWGRVVFVSSGTGSFANGLFTGAPGYSVSKTALNGLTTMLAAQTENTGVLVNAVNPGPTRTRMMPRAERTPEEAAELIADAALLPDDGPSGRFLRGDRVLAW